MPHYFFEVSSEDIFDDEEGAPYPNDEAALKGARQLADGRHLLRLNFCDTMPIADLFSIVAGAQYPRTGVAALRGP